MLVALVLAVGPAAATSPTPARRAGDHRRPGPDTTAVAAPTTQTTWPLPQGVPAGQREPALDLQVTDFDGRTVTLGGFGASRWW